MNKTKIEWCDATVNPVIGCTFGCEYCYAKRLNHRFSYIEDFSKPKFFPERLKQFDSRKPQRIFVDSMSDVADWKLDDAIEIARAIRSNPQHRYLYLTKRPLNAHHKVPLFKNVWFGTSITTEKDYERMLSLATCKIPNSFISIEPIHGDVSSILSSAPIKWIIIGAETGNRKGKIIPEKEWIDRIVQFAQKQDIPVFMKESLLPIVGEENMRRNFPTNLQIEGAVA